jgi:hypothetical protein
MAQVSPIEKPRPFRRMPFTRGLHRTQEFNVTLSKCGEESPIAPIWNLTLLRKMSPPDISETVRPGAKKSRKPILSGGRSRIVQYVMGPKVLLQGLTFKGQRCFGWVATPPLTCYW